jgi:hypothetical protein
VITIRSAQLASNYTAGHCVKGGVLGSRPDCALPYAASAELAHMHDAP